MQATSTWIGGNGSFGTPGDWSTNEVPDGNTVVVVNNGGTVTVSEFEAAGQTTVDGNSTIEILDGPGPKLGVIGTLNIGFSGLGTITVGNQGLLINDELENYNTYLGHNAGSTGVLQSTGGRFFTDELSVGYGGNGTISMTSGSQMFSGQSWLGNLPGSSGSVTLSSSSWSTQGVLTSDFDDVTVGNQGNGQLVATDSSIAVGDFILAATAGTSGSVTLSGGNLTSSKTIFVGQNGAGSLAATNTAIEAKELFVGRNFGASGEASLTGGSLTLSADLHVGALGDGHLTVAGNATMSSDIANIGFGPGAEGVLDFTSGNWTNTRAVFVGVSGNGTLNIGAQGTIHSESGYIAQDVGGVGTVNLNGGSWNMSNTLAVGVFGSGNLTATQGAQVVSEWAQVGLQGTSLGAVQIAGTTWTTNQTLTIGSSGSGTFFATANSTVTAGDVELAGSSGVTGHLRVENSTLITENLLLGDGTGTVEFSGATLRLLGGSSVVDTLLIEGFSANDVTILAGGLTVDTDGGNAEIASVLNGTGALTKTGAGRLRLTVENTYTGGTSIQGGRLEITGNNTLGTGNVALGTAELNAFTTTTLSGDLNGGIQLLSIGGNQTGTFSAATGQTLTLAPLDFLLVAGSTLQIGSAGRAGNVVLAPTGATALTADSFVNVAAGTLIAGNSALEAITTLAQSVTVAAGATLDFNDELSGDGISALIGAGTVSTGSLANTTLKVGSGNFTGLITGQGSLRKNTTGTLVIGPGGNIVVEGSVSVDAGTLVVNGSIGNGLGEVEVNTGGTLAGSGLIGPVKLQGGTLAPGNSAGTLTAADLLWFDGRLEFDLGPDQASSDQLIIGTFEGFDTSYAFTFLDNGWQVDIPYTLIQFAGTPNIAASQFTFTNGGGFDGTFAYQGSTLQFTISAIPEPGTAGLLLFGFATWFCLRRKRVKA